MSNIEPQRLARFASAVYEKTGVPREDAAVIADTLVQADFWGTSPVVCCGPASTWRDCRAGP